MNILITGGAGYIGSHTILELIEKGYRNIYSLDNFLNSDSETYKRIENISGFKVNFEDIDLSDYNSCRLFFQKNKIDSIIHFAALKSVPESVKQSSFYYKNNLNALINLLLCCEEFSINNFIFSSSCSVYGNPSSLPVTESTSFGVAESPYAHTKQIGERILENHTKSSSAFKALSLRYFNPAGAHKSGLIGETITKRPNNLVPIIAQQAIGIRNEFTVFGSDYDTADGSCVRDYVHVSDIAEAHVLAMEYLINHQAVKSYDVFNLGSGSGNTTLEVIRKFETENNLKLNYSIGPRRQGDVEKIYADNEKAMSLIHWKPKESLASIVRSAWKWQQNAPTNDDISPLSK